MEVHHLQKTWDDSEVDHDHFEITLHPSKAGEDSFEISWIGPFFGDPVAPTAPICPEGLWKLWEYEVVEFFFLNDKDQYLEVEVSPSGHHLVLLLNGYRKVVKSELPLTVTASIGGERKMWTGRCKIPIDYFPPDVTKWNAYAIHKSDPDRHYEQLFPSPKGKLTEPDFHRFEFFQDIDFSKFVDQRPQGVSSYWSGI